MQLLKQFSEIDLQATNRTKSLLRHANCYLWAEQSTHPWEEQGLKQALYRTVPSFLVHFGCYPLAGTDSCSHPKLRLPKAETKEKRDLFSVKHHLFQEDVHINAKVSMLGYQSSTHWQKICVIYTAEQIVMV